MVPVTKKVIAGSKPEKAETKRRPRNQELNSSIKNDVPKVRRSLNSSMASDIDRLVGAVKASDANSYDDKLEVLSQTGTYEEQLMADAYYKAEQELSKMYGIPNIMLETSVQNGRGRVDAYTNGGEPGCDTLGSYDFQEETEAVWDLIKSWSGDTAGLVDAIAQKVVNLIELSSEDYGYAYVQGENGLDSACGGKDKLNSATESGLDKLVSDIKSSDATDYNEKYVTLAQHDAYEEELMADAYYKAEQKISEMYNIPKVMLEPSVQQGRGCVNAYTDGGEPGCETISSFDFADEIEAVWDLIKSWNGDTAGLVDAVAQKIVDLVELNSEDYGYAYVQGENGLDSSSQGMNCSESEAIMITTESGNELPITSIKLVQNPDTNELALYVPENEDDEIPEGFAVIGTVISDTASTPAIEENPETGDDENLNSSKRTAVPMNREQRRHPNQRKLNSAKRRKR